MTQWIISSCALICIVLVLRAALKTRISARLRYALWGLVLLRLLLPVRFGHSAVSVMNAVPPQSRQSVQAATDAPAPAQQPSSTLPQAAPSLQTAGDAPAGVRTSAHRIWLHLSPALLLLTLYERDPQCFADCCAEAHLRAMQYRSVVQLLADAAEESPEALTAALDALSGS